MGYRPYRYPRMRRTSVCLRIGRNDLDLSLWPEYQEMNKVLTEYLGELADHIIADSYCADIRLQQNRPGHRAFSARTAA